MKVLVTAASKHGATQEMAFWIKDALRLAGVDAIAHEPSDVSSLDGFDAVVLGSGVYAGKWLGEATRLVERLGPEFQARPVWLFSSGPAGDPPKPEADPVDAEPMRVATAAREHRVFPGRIVRKDLGFAEWAIVSALRVPNGDYRPRPAVEAWAGEIAAALMGTPVVAEGQLVTS